MRLVLYYYRFKPDNIDRPYSITLTTSEIEVSIAIIASCGPAIKALATRFVPTLFGRKSASAPTGNVYYSPHAYARTRSFGVASKSDNRPRDAQYGLRDLEPDGRETDGESQEAIVRTESVKMKQDDFDFGIEDATPAEPRRTFWHRPSD